MQQLTLWDIIPSPTTTSPAIASRFTPLPNPQIAHALKEIADKLSLEIYRLKNSATSQQRPTRRRIQIAEEMYERGQHLENIQHWLLALADLHASGEIPEVLYLIRKRSQVELLYSIRKYTDEELTAIFSLSEYREKFNQFSRIGLNSPRLLKEAIAFFKQLDTPLEETIELKVRKLENELIGQKIPGYFPTPSDVVKLIIEKAQLQPGLTTLEPSAGNGAIAEALRESGCSPDVIEINYSLRKILELKKFNLVADNFLEFHPNAMFDRICMNPPFERGQEIIHVRHAYSCLVPGGILVSVISNSINNSTQKYQNFRQWLSGVGANIQKLPEGAFLKSQVPTGVSTNYVVIQKA